MVRYDRGHGNRHAARCGGSDLVLGMLGGTVWGEIAWSIAKKSSAMRG